MPRNGYKFENLLQNPIQNPKVYILEIRKSLGIFGGISLKLKSQNSLYAFFSLSNTSPYRHTEL